MPPYSKNTAGTTLNGVLEALTDLAGAAVGVDSTGAVLPADFGGYTTVVDDSVPGTTTITSTGAAGTWVQTITTVGSVVTINPPVKQP